MASRWKTGTTRRVSSLALMDTVSAFMRAYKTRMRGLLTHVSSGESSPSRVMVVVVLHKSGALPMGTIAAHTGLPKSNITAIVDDLEAEGLLARRRDEADRRVMHVELTAKGRALSAREYGAYERSLASIFDLLPDDERGPMLSGLERMIQSLREGDAPAEAAPRADRSAGRSRERKAAKGETSGR